MSKDRFDLEQDIMNCWSVVDDLKMLLENDSGYDNDDIQAVARLYQKKFEVLWSTFEHCIKNGFNKSEDFTITLGDHDNDTITVADVFDNMNSIATSFDDLTIVTTNPIEEEEK
jgi:hypothetical protein